MCRFALYLGEEVRLGKLITEPANSIIHQSFHSHERAEPLNGDGFGVTWYPPDAEEPPATFRSTTPAWANQNLREVARVTTTRCMLAHVRAATPGLPVIEVNCHPFVHGRLAFMHNGSVGGFHALRRALLSELSDEAFGAIEGTTDSEHVFALALDALRGLDAVHDDDADPTERLGRALEGAIAATERLRRAAAPDRPSLLNLALSDGTRAAVTRWSSGPEVGNSLYYCTGRVYHCDEGLCRMEDEGPTGSAVIVASEPLDEDPRWVPVEPDHLVLVDEALGVTTRHIALP